MYEMQEGELMICEKCGKDFPEREIDVSHDVPKYLFIDKKEADKWGRHNLCKGCHHEYEVRLVGVFFNHIPLDLKDHLKPIAKKYADNYFKEKGEKNDGDSKP